MGAHLHSFGPEGEGSGHRWSVADSARGDDRHVDPRADQGQEDHGRHRCRAFEPASFATLDDEAVDPRVNRFQRGRERRHHVVDGEASVFEHRGVARGGAGRGRHEAHPLLDHELSDRRVAHERLGDVDAEGSVGEIAHPADLVAHGVEFS